VLKLKFVSAMDLGNANTVRFVGVLKELHVRGLPDV
jgi:hypothetical protein